MIIALCGRAITGKDTAAAIIQDILGDEWRIKMFAYTPKKIVSDLTGIDFASLNAPEVKKSYVGDEWVGPNGMPLLVRDMIIGISESLKSSVSTEIWVNDLFRHYTPDQKWIISDMRFPQEYKRIMKEGGITVRMKREVMKINHYGETALNHLPTHHIIENDGNMVELRKNLTMMLIKENLV